MLWWSVLEGKENEKPEQAKQSSRQDASHQKTNCSRK